jgi:hypothetical protein
MPFGDYLKHVGPLDVGQLHIDTGIPSSPVVCEPVPIVDPLTCRRGTGSRSMSQGQPVPKCDGILKPRTAGIAGMYSCGKCGMPHATVVVNGETRYGALL